MIKSYLHFVFLSFMLVSCHWIQQNANDKSELAKMSFTKPDGSILDSKFWNARKSVIYFGFSHCPDMCPMALTNFGRASLILGPDAKDFHFVFITLDPDRDSPSILANYVNQFPGKNLNAFSPASSSLASLENVFHLTRKKVDIGSTYTVDHSNFIYVLDEHLNQIAAFPGGTSAVQLAKQLRSFLN